MEKKLERYRYNGGVYQFEPGREPAGAEPIKKKQPRKKQAKPKNKAAEPADK